jgi:hypothetical protein
VQTPLLQVASAAAQSALVTQAAQRLLTQRWLLQAMSSAQGSPFTSLQKPAWQTPLKQPASAAHGSPKWPMFMARTQPPSAPSQAVWISQWFTRSSTPLGRGVQVPTAPGTTHDVQMPVHGLLHAVPELDDALELDDELVLDEVLVPDDVPELDDALDELLVLVELPAPPAPLAHVSSRVQSEESW